MEMEVWEKRNSQRAALVAIILAVAFYISSAYIVAPSAASAKSLWLAFIGIGGIALSVLSWFVGLSFFARSKGYSGLLFFALLVVMTGFAGYLKSNGSEEAPLIANALVFGVPLVVVALPDLDARRRRMPKLPNYQW